MKIKYLTILTFALILSACGSNYTIDVDLTPEEITEIKNEISELEAEIANFEPTNNDPTPWAPTIDLASAHAQLGDLGRAIEIYEDFIAEGNTTKSIINNLGHLYEKVGKYDLAIEQYQFIIDEYVDQNYLKNIAKAYIGAKDFENAEKYYADWSHEFNRTDVSIEAIFEDVRSAEKSQ